MRIENDTAATVVSRPAVWRANETCDAVEHYTTFQTPGTPLAKTEGEMKQLKLTANNAEEWKPIPGHPAYVASNHGQIKKLYSGKGGNGGAIILAIFTAPVGYQFVKIVIDGRKYTFGVHQLVAAAFIGPCPRGHEVNHIDGNKANNIPENLEYVTHKENCQLSTKQRGRIKLTTEIVYEIRQALEAGERQVDVGARYGVAQGTVSAIKRRTIWKRI